MIFGLFRKNPAFHAVHAVYSAIVAQSRQPRPYAEWGVPDTVTGRFDMISLHLALLFRRLRAEGPEATRFSQAVFDLFFMDMDRSLREMGVTDLGVPKKIRKMESAFYPLLASVGEALDAGDQVQLEAVLVRNVFAEGAVAGAGPLAWYLKDEAAHLETQPAADIVAGRITTGIAA